MRIFLRDLVIDDPQQLEKNSHRSEDVRILCCQQITAADFLPEQRFEGDATAFDDRYRAFDIRSYLPLEIELSLDDAAKFAEALGGHLVTITSAEENTSLASFIETGVLPHEVRLGLRKTGSGNMGWTWVSGEPLKYHQWGPDSGGSESHASLGLHKGEWDWFHGSSEALLAVVIEWDSPSPQPPAKKAAVPAP
jgi:hypothetical protein